MTTRPNEAELAVRTYLLLTEEDLKHRKAALASKMAHPHTSPSEARDCGEKMSQIANALQRKAKGHRIG